MRKFFCAAALAVTFVFCLSIARAGSDTKQTGENLFKERCAVCHPDGGNIIRADKTLRKNDLAARNIRETDDVVKVMRKPGAGMPTFDQSTVPDDEARRIAAYILSTFK